MCAPMKERRYRPGVAVVDGKIYVLGGEEGWDRSVSPLCSFRHCHFLTINESVYGAGYTPCPETYGTVKLLACD